MVKCKKHVRCYCVYTPWKTFRPTRPSSVKWRLVYVATCWLLCAPLHCGSVLYTFWPEMEQSGAANNHFLCALELRGWLGGWCMTIVTAKIFILALQCDIHRFAFFLCFIMYSQSLHIQLYFAQIYYQVSLNFVQTKIILIYDFVMFWM